MYVRMYVVLAVERVNTVQVLECYHGAFELEGWGCVEGGQ